MAAPKKKPVKRTATKKTNKSKTAGTYPQHVAALTYFVLVLSLIFLYMVTVRYALY